MQKKEWVSLKKLNDEDDFVKELKVGERFLYGSKVSEQSTEIGGNIWYYQVIKIDEAGCEYMPVFDMLEEDVVIKSEEE